jgi:hypothetical protein
MVSLTYVQPSTRLLPHYVQTEELICFSSGLEIGGRSWTRLYRAEMTVCVCGTMMANLRRATGHECILDSLLPITPSWNLLDLLDPSLNVGILLET